MPCWRITISGETAAHLTLVPPTSMAKKLASMAPLVRMSCVCGQGLWPFVPEPADLSSSRRMWGSVWAPREGACKALDAVTQRPPVSRTVHRVQARAPTSAVATTLSLTREGPCAPPSVPGVAHALAHARAPQAFRERARQGMGQPHAEPHHLPTELSAHLASLPLRRLVPLSQTGRFPPC